MRWIAPWLLCLILAVGLLFEWQRAEVADENAFAQQAAAAEASSIYLELKAEHAKWLTLGLRELRAGDEADGYRALDTLLASTVRGLDSSGPNGDTVKDALSYLAEVGNPWYR